LVSFPVSQYKIILFKGGVNLYTGRNPAPIDLTDPFERTMLNVMSSFAILDNELRTERFRLGRIAAVVQGGWKGGPPPYGYEVVEKKLIPNEEEKKNVNLMFEMYKDGKGHSDIRNHFLMKGILTRRNNQIWSNGSIDNVLFNNTHYDGYWYFEDKVTLERHRVQCDRIVPSKLYREVQELKKKRSYNSKHKSGPVVAGRNRQPNQKYKYLLQDLMKCGHCGSVYRVQKQKHKNEYGYYFCSNKRSLNITSQKQFNKEPCEVDKSIKNEIIDEMVWNSIVEVLNNSNLYKEKIKIGTLGEGNTYSGSKKEEGKKKSKIKKLENQSKAITENIIKLEVEKRTSNDVDIEHTNNIINGMEDVLSKVKSEIDELTTDIDKGQNDRKWIDWVKGFESHIKSLTEMDKIDVDVRRDIVKGVIEEIVVHQKDGRETELSLQFKLPFVNDGLIWKNPKKKSLGYELVDGNHFHNITLPSSKKKLK